MSQTLRCLTTILAFTFIAQFAAAQGTKSDYERAESYRERMSGKVFRDRVEPRWIGEGSDFWYRIQTGQNKHEFIVVCPEVGKREHAFDHEQLAAALSKQQQTDIAPTSLPIRELDFTEADAIGFSAFGKRWRYRNDGSLVRADKSNDGVAESKSTATVLKRMRPSAGSGEDTNIRFVNETDSMVKLFWYSSADRQVPYGTIGAGDEKSQHTFVGHTWLVTNEDDEPLAGFAGIAGDSVAYIEASSSVEVPEPNKRYRRRKNRETSTNDRWEASIREFNVWIRNRATDELFALTSDGTESDAFTGPFHFSPDGKRLVVMQTEQGETRTIYHIESSPKDRLQPVVHDMEYAKPGDKLPVKRPRMFNLESKKQIEVKNSELYTNAWSINRPRWAADSSRFDFVYNARGHQTLRIISIDAQSGVAQVIVDEQCETFIDYAGKQFSHFVADSDEIIWMSERDGWNHLYLFDGESPKPVNQVTLGEWVVREVERVDDEHRQIWFQASGVFPDQDPYYIHLGRVDFDGENLVWITRANGTHRWQFSPDNQFVIDTWSRVDQAPVNELRSAVDGSLVCELESADVSELQNAGWIAPEPFFAKGRDGETDICGVIVRPTNFSEDKTYPVIEKIYAGPHSSFVPKSFGQTRGMAAMAEHGFILVQIDGMGTSNRSKAFHDVCWKNLGDSGFPDRIAWMKAAAEKNPEMDLSRVGIYGGSAGGQSALRAMLMHSDFYKAAAADCGCHDNRMDKVWWNELWMGWPIGPHYEEQSNVTQAHRLTGKLLLTVGELDRNVDPASTMQVVDALIKADKDFDLIVVPGAGHGVGERPYAKRRRTDFFVRHLMGIEPRSED